MSRFAYRSDETELIDEPGIPFADWEVCLRELNTINTYLGGHKITTKGIQCLLAHKNTSVNHHITVCEIGCGGGDNLKAIEKWRQKNLEKVTFDYVGIDINEACTEFASVNCDSLNARFLSSDYKAVDFGEKKPSVIFNSLFCHHFNNGQLIEMLTWMKNNSTIGFFINDLQRHPLAYHSIRMLTKAFSRSYLVKHDAPISVHRGFHKNEWLQLLNAAGISSYRIQWMWAFRFLVLAYNEH